jgi:probable phosphoglycerate mutase
VIVVVRHGRTLSNAQGLFLGRADPPLDDVGRAQAAALGAAIGPVDEVITSPLLRAQETAEAIDGPVRVDERFIELDYGEWDQQPLADVDPEAWGRWQSDMDFAPPGGESLLAVGERVRHALDEIAPEGRRRTVVIVTHVSPLKAAVAWALGVPDDISWRLFVTPASITRIDVSRGRPSLHGFNDTAHLAAGR